MTIAGSAILLVDDDDDIRESLGDFLEYSGYQTLAARNGQEALDILEREGGACVILLDVMMPTMNGYDFRKEQRTRPRLSQIPVIVLTAGGAVREDELEAAAVLNKPLDLQKLVSMIQTYC